MKKLTKKLFFIGIFVYLISLGEAFSEEKKIEFISPEKAFESLSEFSEIKSLERKYRCEKFQCVGHGFGTSVVRWPEKNFPFYVLRFDVTEDVEKTPGIYLAKEIYAGLFYIDAYTAEVYPQEIEQEIISEKRTEEGIRNIEESVLTDKEHALKNELEKAYIDIEKSASLHAEEYKNLIQKSMPLFLKSLNAITPEVRLEGIRILRQLANLSRPPGVFEVKPVIPRLIELLKDGDHRVRYDAVTVLAYIGEKEDKRLVEPILALLNDSNILVRQAAINALIKLGNSGLTPKFTERLNVSVKPAKRNYSHKEKIKLFFSLKNNGTTPIIINAVSFQYGDVLFKALDPKGKPVLYIGLKYRRTLFPEKKSLITLKPGRNYKAGPFDIRQYYNFETPGEYQIIGRYENNFTGIDYGLCAWVGKIESPAVKITVR